MAHPIIIGKAPQLLPSTNSIPAYRTSIPIVSTTVPVPQVISALKSHTVDMSRPPQIPMSQGPQIPTVSTPTIPQYISPGGTVSVNCGPPPLPFVHALPPIGSHGSSTPSPPTYPPASLGTMQQNKSIVTTSFTGTNGGPTPSIFAAPVPTGAKPLSYAQDGDDDDGGSGTYETRPSDFDKKTTAVFLKHTDGYLIRQIIETCNSNLTSAPLICTPKALYILRGNAGPNMIIYNVLRANCFIDYYINPEFANAKGLGSYFDFKKYDPEYDETNEIFHVINLSLSDFHSEIKSSVARKEHIAITQYSHDMAGVYFKVFGGNRNADGGLRLSVIPYNHETYNIPEFAPTPNRNVPLSEFSNLCTQIKRVKGTKAVMRAYPECIILCGDKDSGNSSRMGKWGNIGPNAVTVASDSNTDGKQTELVVEDESDPKEWDVEIPRPSTAGMAKSSNLCSNGIIRVYCNKDGLCKLQIPYWAGEMQIILYDPSKPV
jgi:hypothetical protein